MLGLCTCLELDLGVGSTSPDPAPACPGGTPRAGGYRVVRAYWPRSSVRRGERGGRGSRSRASSVSPRAPRRGSCSASGFVFRFDLRRITNIERER